MRYPFKCPSNAFDGVFLEHVLEHFDIDGAAFVLREIWRILKPSGVVRIIVPSLESSVEGYLLDKQNPATRALASERIRTLAQEWLHLSVWDFDRLELALKEAGFLAVERASFGKSRDEVLIFDLKSRQNGSLYAEASKPKNA